MELWRELTEGQHHETIRPAETEAVPRSNQSPRGGGVSKISVGQLVCMASALSAIHAWSGVYDRAAYDILMSLYIYVSQKP